MFFNSRNAFFFVKTTKVNSFVNCRCTAKLITMFIIHTSQIHENSSRMIPSKAKIVWFHILTRTWLTPVDWNYKKSFVSDIIKKWNSLNFTKLEKPFLLSFLGKVRLIYIHVYVLLNLQNNFLLRHSFTGEILYLLQDSNHSLGQRWHFVGPTLTNDVGSMSFCWLGRLNCQQLVRWWSNVLSPTSPAYANVMPTILFQVSRSANVGPTWY